MSKTSNFRIRRWAKKIIAVRLLGGSCVRCGISDIRLLSFHHIKDKVEKLNDMFRKNINSEEFRQEIGKCELMCCRCHMVLHNSAKNNLLKQVIPAERLVCAMCGFSDSNGLEFHHNDPKRKVFELSASCTGDRIRKPVEVIMNELAKCSVLCANCHLLHHAREDFNIEEAEAKARSYDQWKRLPSLDEETVRDLVSEGKTCTEIASITGRKKSTVYYVLKRLGLEATRGRSGPR